MNLVERWGFQVRKTLFTVAKSLDDHDQYTGSRSIVSGHGNV